MDTGRGTSHTGACWKWGTREGGRKGWGDWGGIVLKEIPNMDDGVMDAANHHGLCIPM